MDFSRLYIENREAVENALRAMWCGEAGNNVQRAYALKLSDVIKELFAPDDAMPLVQCMNSYKTVHSVSKDEATKLIDGLWKATYSPYEHQYQCWNTLLKGMSPQGKPMSICVTTGTGSGKTECFMMPLVKDLIENHKDNQVQALFLYPLNALMEDQKERLESLLEGTSLTYTVYNGDLPEREPSANDHSDDAEQLRNRIRQIRGVDEKTGEPRFKHLLYTRKMVRETPPNILLTNPTMLEYVLLRQKDNVLTNPALQSLRWIAIDETHTYTGAGAAEMAMLLRRVLLAFGQDAKDIRFATSSATFGNGANPGEEERQLRQFIANMTGLDCEQVRVVDGERVGEDSIPNNEDADKWRLLFHKDYIKLSELIPGDITIEQRLHLLDEMCERVPFVDDMPLMKAKVHYFYRVPNSGLFVKLTECEDGVFNIYTKTSTDDSDEANQNPLLELARCKHCGEYLTMASLNTAPGEDFGKYSPIERDDNDIFDVLDEEDAEGTSKVVIGMADSSPIQACAMNSVMEVVGNKLLPSSVNKYRDTWHLIVNGHGECPHCGSKLSKRKDDDDIDITGDGEGVNHSSLAKFRNASEFVSRVMADSILNQVEKGTSRNPAKVVLHDGQQFLSFADSRQLAAKATLQQNLEQERLWLYTTIYRELNIRKNQQANNAAKIVQLTAQLPSLVNDVQKMMAVANEIQELQKNCKNYLSWQEIAQILSNDKYYDVFCTQFVKRTGTSEELDKRGEILPFVREKYVQSLMVKYLAHRPLSAASPENMGLFHSHYPQLDNVQLPEEVNAINNILSESNKITENDWRNLIQLFLDYTVRSNQSVFLKIADDNAIDIFACERFATEKPHRRPSKKPVVERGKPSNSRVVRQLCQLVADDKGNMKAEDVYREYFDVISTTIDALWADITNPEYKLLEQSEHWSVDNHRFESDRQDSPRLNLVNMSFKLYDEVWLCDTNNDNSSQHTQVLRPIENRFKTFSPYLLGVKVRHVDENMHEKWEAYTFNEDGHQTAIENIANWAKEKRTVLWNSIWGENGVFSSRLNKIHQTPNLFIQAEHTAQVDKDVSRTLQQDFKDHTINILACSTTMEMGVDLGNLEVVMLTSVPPQPSNYKQRAGRSGRNNKVKSVCITLCNSDVIGLRTLKDPLSNIINRPVKVPSVDLKSPQVVQRHVNAFLVRAFGVFNDGEDGGKLSQQVFNYYTSYERHKEGKKTILTDVTSNSRKDPSYMMGSETGTMYEKFNQLCRTDLPDDTRADLEQLLKGTIFEDNVSFVIDRAEEANRRCYKELEDKSQNFADAFAMAGASGNDKLGTLIKMQYYEMLFERLLNFWATSRFTPNANMPVNVLSLNLETTGKKLFGRTTSSNPSYGLREAISQYAPGNNVVVDGVAYTVRGIETTNMYKGINTFKKIYFNGDKCTVNDDSLSDKRIWAVNGREDLELIQPVAFVPDMNEDMSRRMDTNVYTRVSAQLIDTEEWKDEVSEPHLFSIRSNKNTGNAQILYYNEGLEHGYCFCSQCGRMVLELEEADRANKLANLPDEMNPVKNRDGNRPNYHLAIRGKDFHMPCGGSNNRDTIRRNVIIGDLIQTDYVEIRIRHKGKNHWMNSRKEENLLFTLGIVFTQALLDILGKERGAVDFAIMPNGHICLFDTNPGGAGYANQLDNVPMMKEVISAAKKALINAKDNKAKDLLLDKFTLRFINKIDVDAALNWINEEEESRDNIPADIAQVSREATEVCNINLEHEVAQLNHEMTIFVSDRYSNWNYAGKLHSWRGIFLSRYGKHPDMVNICVIHDSDATIPEPALEMLRMAKNGWAKEIKEMKNPFSAFGVHPIAYVNDTLYFTNVTDSTDFNSQWSNGVLYCARMEDISRNANIVDYSYNESTQVFFLKGEDAKRIESKNLGAIIYEHSHSIIDSFVYHCSQSSEPVRVIYQDEHLKKILGMVITIQVIDDLVKRIKKSFTLEFKMEQYEETTNRRGITANYPNDSKRDSKLNDLCEGWLYSLDDEEFTGELIPIHPLTMKTLPHWRELLLECDGKRLRISPDGGFTNGWDLDVNSKFYTEDNTDSSDNINLKRRDELKFGVNIEDINS